MQKLDFGPKPFGELKTTCAEKNGLATEKCILSSREEAFIVAPRQGLRVVHVTTEASASSRVNQSIEYRYLGRTCSADNNKTIARFLFVSSLTIVNWGREERSKTGMSAVLSIVETRSTSNLAGHVVIKLTNL